MSKFQHDGGKRRLKIDATRRRGLSKTFLQLPPQFLGILHFTALWSWCSEWRNAFAFDQVYDTSSYVTLRLRLAIFFKEQDGKLEIPGRINNSFLAFTDDEGVPRNVWSQNWTLTTVPVPSLIKTVSSCVVQIVCVITNQGSSNPNCLNFLKDAYKVYQGVPPTYRINKDRKRWKKK